MSTRHVQSKCFTYSLAIVIAIALASTKDANNVRIMVSNLEFNSI